MNFILLPILCIAAASAATHDATCAGGRRDGEQATIGNFYYECRNGQLVPKGCLGPDNRRIDLSRTYDSKSVRLECVIDRSGNPALIQHACIYNGREYMINDKWDDGKSVYTCMKDGDYLSLRPVGCVAADGHRLMIGEKTTIRDVVYECRLSSQGMPQAYQWGCVGKDGRQYASGDSYDHNGYWYFCMERHGTMNAEMIGCVHNGQRLKHGDRWIENDIVYSCIVSMTSAEVRVMGCVTRDSVTGARDEKRVGCSWQEGRAPFQYTLTCEPDTARKTAYRKAVRCDYSVEKGTYEVELGCYRVVDKTGVACLKGSGPADVNFIALQLDDQGHVRNPPSGARLC